MPQTFDDLILVKSLQTLACFTIAKELWSLRDIKHRIDACLRAQEYKNGTTCFPRQLVQFLNEVHELAEHLYPIIPIYFKKIITEIIDFIGEDIFDWMIVGESHQSVIIQEMLVWDVHLTPFHTVDRIKSGCLSQNFNFASPTLCKCCYQKYVGKRWKKLDAGLKSEFEQYFGEYKFHAIAYWKCYVHVSDYSIVQEKVIVNNLDLFENFTPLENIFKISVYCGYDVAVVYYWNLMTNEQKISNLNTLFFKRIFPESIFETWMERWTNERTTSKAQISTFCFVWNQLPEFYRRKLMLFSYWKVFILMIRWRIDDSYFRQVFDTWRPMCIAPRLYERTLRVSASNITKGEKHQKIYSLLWKPVDNFFTNEKVAEFIWKYLTIYEDIESAEFIVNEFDQQRKIEIMASLSRMIDVYNVNQEYQTRLQDFLATEISLTQPTAGDAILEIEQNPSHNEVRNISMIILFLIILIYFLFVLICIINPFSRTTHVKPIFSTH